MVSGLSAAELEAGGEGATPSAALRPVLRGIGLFVAGFTLVFVALGAAASSIGRLLDAHEITLSHVSGAVIVLLGVVMLLGALPSSVWTHAGSGTLGIVSRVTGEHRFDVRPSKLGAWAAPLMGMAFAFAWTPCIGPVLGVVLSLAARNGTLSGGVLLLFAYSLGLAVPFVLVGLAFSRLTSDAGPDTALAVGRRTGGRRGPRGLWGVVADGQRELGLDAALEPPERRRPGTPQQELRPGSSLSDLAAAIERLHPLRPGPLPVALDARAEMRLVIDWPAPTRARPRPVQARSASSAANVRAKVNASPGQRAET